MLYTVMQAAPPAPNPLGTIIPMVLIFVIFWFLLIRPQQKRAKAHQELLKTVNRGDVIVTNGGIVGKVTKATDDDLTVEIAPNTRITVLRGMVADVRRPEVANDAAPAKAPAKKSKKK